MMKKISTYPLILLIMAFIFNACITPIDIETLEYEDVLVVTAILTDEMKHQEVILSRSYRFEDEIIPYESGANVKIVDDQNSTYTFREEASGRYLSENEFKAIPDKKYRLMITLRNGKSYVSKEVSITQHTEIDNIYAVRETNNSGIDGMSIYVDSYDPTGNSKYYRYEYEESYKIIAPYWSPVDLVVVNDKYLVKQQKTKEERVCYNTVSSNTIIQTETTALTEDKVAGFNVRFIPKDNPVITHRYSILVKQYVQSLEAYTYYKTLGNLSGSDNIFSENQPGFITGNIFSTEDKREKVIGIFEAASVSSKRLFFNFTDFFPQEPLPPYFTKCNISAPNTINVAGDPSVLVELILAGDVKYYQDNPNYPNPLDETEGKYNVVESPCGDCTKLGSNVKPDFWED